MIRKIQQRLPYTDYTTKLTIAILHSLMAAVALNVFWRPGNIYAGGITGISQIVSEVLTNIGITQVSVAMIYFGLNIPLFILAWYKISHKFTVFTIIDVTLTSLAIQILPVTALSTDPIICALFGGALNGAAIGLALKNGISTGGLDIVSLTLRKLTGKSVGSFTTIINIGIALVAGYLFGWPFAFYSMLSFFISGKVMDLFFTKQQKMQVMIVTTKPKEVVDAVQERLRRGITLLNNAEGAFNGSPQTVLYTVITRYEMHDLEDAMAESDRQAFVSISDTVKIIGNFYEADI